LTTQEVEENGAPAELIQFGHFRRQFSIDYDLAISDLPMVELV